MNQIHHLGLGGTGVDFFSNLQLQVVLVDSNRRQDGFLDRRANIPEMMGLLALVLILEGLIAITN